MTAAQVPTWLLCKNKSLYWRQSDRAKILESDLLYLLDKMIRMSR